MAPLPAWLVPPIAKPTFHAVVRSVSVLPPMPRYGIPRHYMTRQEIIDAIPDKIVLAESWGMVTKGSPNQAGWIKCHAVTREDKHPSAMFSAINGCYWEPDMNRKPLSLFDLGCVLGVYTDFSTAAQHLRAVYAA